MQPVPTNGDGTVVKVHVVAVPAQYKNGDPAAGKAVFTSAGCAGCHTLADANAHGTVGPNLDHAEAAADEGRPAGDQRRRRDAGLQGHPDREADRRCLRLRREGDRRQPVRLTLSLPDGFPRDVRVVATDFDRTLVWDGRPAAADAGRAHGHARGRPRRDRRHRADGAVGAALPRAGGACRAGHLLPGRGRRRRRREVAAARADPARARARGDRARRRRRATASTSTSATSCTSPRATQGSRDYAGFQHLEIHEVGDLLEWLARAADQARLCGRPGGARRRRGADEGAFRRPPLHLEVASVLPRVRRSRGDEGRGARFPGRPHGLHARADDRLRRRRERRRARRMGRVRHRRRERARRA